MKTIRLSEIFGGITLLIVKSDDGFERVPLKPICEVIGVDWNTQHKKMKLAYVSSRLGVALENVKLGIQVRRVVMIRVDRIFAFLDTINPECVRGAGNSVAANYIEQKHHEHDCLIQKHEEAHGDLFAA